MEQCINSKGASATFRLSNVLFCVLVLLVLQSAYAGSGDSTRDYLLPGESRGGFVFAPLRAQSSGSVSHKQATVSYQAFDGANYSLAPHPGHYVTLLLPAGGANTHPLTADHIEELVDRLDILYATYKELMQGEPLGSGLLTVAFVPETCGLACGYIGSKGIEIQQDAGNYDRIIHDLDAGKLDSILTHEMAHNFDLYWNYLHYLPDHGHAWTNMFEYFAPFRFGREGRDHQLPDDLYQSPANSIWKPYIEDDSANWERCVRDQLCHASGFTENHLWAMLYYRVEKLHGVGAVLRSFDYLKSYAQSNPPPGTPQQKEDLRLMSLAVGVGANISCYLDALKWTVSPTLRNDLQARFGSGGALCADSDKDGYSLITGDCDDHNAAKSPIALEVQSNGTDDDCDEIKDEHVVLESSSDDLPSFSSKLAEYPLPLEVDADLSDLDDRDAVRFALPANGRVEVNLCARGGFSGWVAALQSNGQFLNSDYWYEPLDVTGCSRKVFDFGSQPTGQLEVMANNNPGQYSLTVSAAKDMPADRSPLLSIMPKAGNGMDLVFDDPLGSMSAIGADEIEVWISGQAMRFTVPLFGQSTSFSLNATSASGLTTSNRYQARFRPLKNGRPLEGFSAGHLFRYDKTRNTPLSLDGGFSGAWFDPSHDGEGFVVEINDDGRALVYWFTFTADGAQRWMLGVGEAHGNAVTVSELLSPHGGRFGDNFNPDDVTFEDSGSLEISFLDCDNAIVNYSVDQIGGHQELVRLNNVFGHPCGKPAQSLGSELNGSWYDPTHSGEGFVVQQLSETDALVYWFSYNESGEQAWMFNTGHITGETISVGQLLQPSGGKFGRSFDPASVGIPAWGTLEMQLDCQGGIASYDTHLADFSSGDQQLTPLTRLQHSACNY